MQKKYVAEAIGTFVLVFGGCGTAVLDAKNVGVLGVSIAFGLTLLTMAYAIGPISGCHINPAVTVGLIFAGRADKKDLAGYVVAQILGGIAAAAVLFAIANGHTFGYDLKEGLAANGYGEHSPGGYGLLAGLLAEIVLTALLLFVVLATTDKRAPSGFAGLPIGLALTLIHLIGIPITNTSVNPARSIGPALFVRGWALEQLWLFIVAPVIGAIFGALIYRFLEDDEPVSHKSVED
ncbi:aquaporin Z [Pendulispora albinea]|uniref:Aquaporin Z n=1 Tax=Pendulispora albinea TaxID=2741071 RepID=A0ABZ2M566_9BACT